MYVHPFAAGVICTIFVEVILFIGMVIYFNGRRKPEKKKDANSTQK